MARVSVPKSGTQARNRGHGQTPRQQLCTCIALARRAADLRVVGVAAGLLPSLGGSEVVPSSLALGAPGAAEAALRAEPTTVTTHFSCSASPGLLSTFPSSSVFYHATASLAVASTADIIHRRLASSNLGV